MEEVAGVLRAGKTRHFVHAVITGAFRLMWIAGAIWAAGFTFGAAPELYVAFDYSIELGMTPQCRKELVEQWPDLEKASTIFIIDFAWGNFGNQFYQLIRALWLAECFGMHRVVSEKSIVMLDLPFNTTRGIRYEVNTECDNCARAYYFFFDSWPRSCDLPTSRIALTFRDEVLTKLPEVHVPEDDVVAWLRSGDIWGPRPIDGAQFYAQPPCVFFREAVNLSRGARAHVLTEVFGGERTNPWSAQVLALPNAVRVEPGPKLAVAYLMSARRVVLG
jgi:hypothetical protein